MKKRILSLTLVCILVQSLFVASFATSKSEVQGKIDDSAAQLKQVDGELSEELQAIEELSSQISSVEDEISKLKSQISDLESSIKQKTKEIDEKQDEIDENEELLQKRLVVLYEAGDTSFLDILVSSNGLMDFLSNYYMLTQLTQCDTDLIGNIEKDKQSIEKIKSQLEDEKSQINDAKKQQEQKSSELKTKKAEKDKKVSSLSEEKKSIQTKIDEYDKEMKKIEDAEKKAVASTSTSYKYDGGKLQWPVPGYGTSYITSPYGYRIHPIYGTRKFHSGIDIGAPKNSSIIAAESGTVILASYGYNGGYGNYIIIDHGNGLTTRYAHCNSLNVSVGQKVSRGDLIGKVGTTGDSTGNHLHFEVRINSETQNPMNFIN